MTGEEPDEFAAFDAEPIHAVLERHRVEYVIVCGYAARMHGSTRPTRDIEVTPATTVGNLDRLAAALRDLDACIRTDAVPEGLPFTASGESLIGQRMLNPADPARRSRPHHPAGRVPGRVRRIGRAVDSSHRRRGSGAGRGTRGRHPLQGDRSTRQGRSRAARAVSAGQDGSLG